MNGVWILPLWDDPQPLPSVARQNRRCSPARTLDLRRTYRQAGGAGFPLSLSRGTQQRVTMRSRPHRKTPAPHRFLRTPSEQIETDLALDTRNLAVRTSLSAENQPAHSFVECASFRQHRESRQPVHAEVDLGEGPPVQQCIIQHDRKDTVHTHTG